MVNIKDIKIGDTVFVRDDLVVGQKYGRKGTICWTSLLDKMLKGKPCKVLNVRRLRDYGLVECTSDEENFPGVDVSIDMLAKHVKKPISRYEQIRAMSLKEFAENSLMYNPNAGCYFTLDGKSFGTDEVENALQHQVEWLSEKAPLKQTEEK